MVTWAPGLKGKLAGLAGCFSDSAILFDESRYFGVPIGSWRKVSFAEQGSVFHSTNDGLERL